MAISKVAASRVIFKEIFERGYQLNGRSQRAVFIERSMAELSVSRYCAATYFQNLSNEAAGKPLYKYNKARPRRKAVVEASTSLLLLTHQARGRWMVVSKDVEVHNFKTRGEAQKFAKDNGLEWKDRNKAA